MSGLDLSDYIRVINRTGQRIKAKYDGTDYIFEDGEPTDVHNLAATHIFGFAVDDKTNAFHRLGWLAAGASVDEAMERLRDIEFTDVPNPSTNIKSAAGKRGKASKTGSPTPLASPGADDEGGSSGPSSPDASEDEEETGTF